RYTLLVRRKKRMKHRPYLGHRTGTGRCNLQVYKRHHRHRLLRYGVNTICASLDWDCAVFMFARCADGREKSRNCTRRCVCCADGREKYLNCTRRHVCCEDGSGKCRNCTRRCVCCADGREKCINCTRKQVYSEDGKVNCHN